MVLWCRDCLREKKLLRKEENLYKSKETCWSPDFIYSTHCLNLMRLLNIKGVLCQTFNIYNFSCFVPDLKPQACQKARCQVRTSLITLIFSHCEAEEKFLSSEAVWGGAEHSCPKCRLGWWWWDFLWKDGFLKKKMCIYSYLLGFSSPMPYKFPEPGCCI